MPQFIEKKNGHKVANLTKGQWQIHNKKTEIDTTTKAINTNPRQTQGIETNKLVQQTNNYFHIYNNNNKKKCIQPFLQTIYTKLGQHR